MVFDEIDRLCYKIIYLLRELNLQVNIVQCSFERNDNEFGLRKRRPYVFHDT